MPIIIDYNAAMESFIALSVPFVALLIVVFASQKIGDLFSQFKLPLISGFLAAGVIAGPFVLDFVHTDNIPQFKFLGQIALAFIGFAAGAELELQVIRGYFRSIISTIGAQVIVVLAIGITAFVLIQDMIPFMEDLPQREVLAVAMLGATIMIARSPSSALAIIKELRAHGPFTHKVLGATVLMDAVVIIIFAISVSVADVLVKGAAFNMGLFIFVVFEILLDIGLGILIGLLLRLIVSLPSLLIQGTLILLLGLSVFFLSVELHNFHFFGLPIGLFSEPLLVCLIAGFYVTNYSRVALDFRHVLEKMSPGVFLLFFTLVGIELQVETLGQVWKIMLFLCTVRFVGIFVGCLLGNTIAQERSSGSYLLGFGFITQAGVSVGLAKEVAVEFSTWGNELATLSIGVIVINQIVGPPILKWVINRVGESHTRAAKPEFDGVRDAIIFGVEGQSIKLVRQLESHEWNVILVTLSKEIFANKTVESPQIEFMPEITETALRELNIERAESVVLMLSDEENLTICELVYEKFGIENVIVRLQDPNNFDKFQGLALAVNPGTAMVNLLDQFVRSPFTASLLLGMDPDEEFMEIEMNNPDLNGVAIRDIHLPHDALILSISRSGSRLISHGYTRLEIGDHIAVVGLPDSLAEIEVRFEP